MTEEHAPLFRVDVELEARRRGFVDLARWPSSDRVERDLDVPAEVTRVSTGAVELDVVSWRREYGHAVVRVTDTGPGIRPEQLEHLFEMLLPGTETAADTVRAPSAFAPARLTR